MKLRLIAPALVLATVLVSQRGLRARPAGGGRRRTALHGSSGRGKPLGEAKSDLRDAGYKVGTVTPDRAAESGEVSRQDPVAGTSVARGSEVDLVVEDGR